MAVVNKFNTEKFHTIAVGDRVETWDGIWGWVTGVEFHTVKNYLGDDIVRDATLTITSEHLPTFDSWGWPKSYAGTITRSVRKYSDDLRWAYTPATVTV